MYDSLRPGSGLGTTPRGWHGGNALHGSGACLTADCAAKMKFRVLLQTPAVKNHSPGA
jgi:hypothetical protein